MIMVWELDADIKVQEDEVTAGFAETEHGIVASCPVTTVYIELGMFTTGRPEIHFEIRSHLCSLTREKNPQGK